MLENYKNLQRDQMFGAIRDSLENDLKDFGGNLKEMLS